MNTSQHLAPMKETIKLGLAMYAEAYPCNPRPFAYGLLKYLLNGGSITDRPAKRVLHTLTGTLDCQIFFFSMKDIMAKIGETPKDPIRVLQEMEELTKVPGFYAQDDWKPLLPHLILAAYKSEGYYDSLAEYKNLHPLRDSGEAEVIYHQLQDGENVHIHTWET